MKTAQVITLIGLGFILGMVFLTVSGASLAVYKDAPEGCKATVYAADNGDYFRVYICRKR